MQVGYYCGGATRHVYTDPVKLPKIGTLNAVRSPGVPLYISAYLMEGNGLFKDASRYRQPGNIGPGGGRRLTYIIRQREQVLSDIGG